MRFRSFFNIYTEGSKTPSPSPYVGPHSEGFCPSPPPRPSPHSKSLLICLKMSENGSRLTFSRQFFSLANHIAKFMFSPHFAGTNLPEKEEPHIDPPKVYSSKSYTTFSFMRTSITKFLFVVGPLH